MRILAIQLGKSSDVARSFPALAGLKQRYPDSHIDFLVQDSSIPTARLCSEYDRLIGLPLPFILENATDQKVESLAKLITWIADDILETTKVYGPYSLLLNWTFSESSSYLAELIPADQKRGLRRAEDGAYAVTDPWGSYTYSQVLRQNFNIIHMTELFARMGGVAAIQPRVLGVGFDSSADLGPLAVGLHLSYGDSGLALNPHLWIQLVKGILDGYPEAHIVLFGTRKFRTLANEISESLMEEQQSRLTILTGRLKRTEEIFWLKRCHHLISLDTAFIPIASALNVSTIQLNLGRTRPHDTGPWGKGHFVIDIKDVGMESGTSGFVDSILGLLLSESPSLPTWRSDVIIEEEGTERSALTPMNFKPDEIRNFFEQTYYLLFEFRNAGRNLEIPIHELGSVEQANGIHRLITALDSLNAIHRLGEFGQNYCIEMLRAEKDKDRLRLLGDKVTEVEVMLRQIKESVSWTKPLVDTWEVQQENILGMDIQELAAKTEGNFRELVQNVLLVQQLLNIAVTAAESRLGIQDMLRPSNQKEMNHDKDLN